MLVVETIAKIRRAYFVQKKAIKEICRELKVSRKTVRRVVRSGATEFVYERKVQPQPKIGPWREELDRLLAPPAPGRLDVCPLDRIDAPAAGEVRQEALGALREVRHVRQVRAAIGTLTALHSNQPAMMPEPSQLHSLLS
jgi:hypothetical protein